MRVRTGTKYTSIKRFSDAHSAPPLIIVSTKHDLKAEREVTAQEGEALAQDLGCGLVDVSAKLNAKADAAFHGIIRASRGRENRRSTSDWRYRLACGIKKRIGRLKS